MPSALPPARFCRARASRRTLRAARGRGVNPEERDLEEARETPGRDDARVCGRRAQEELERRGVNPAGVCERRQIKLAGRADAAQVRAVDRREVRVAAEAREHAREARAESLDEIER